jgi:hypothetical protein
VNTVRMPQCHTRRRGVTAARQAPTPGQNPISKDDAGEAGEDDSVDWPKWRRRDLARRPYRVRDGGGSIACERR